MFSIETTKSFFPIYARRILPSLRCRQRDDGELGDHVAMFSFETTKFFFPIYA
jgi:hypothetical protein